MHHRTPAIDRPRTGPLVARADSIPHANLLQRLVVDRDVRQLERTQDIRRDEVKRRIGLALAMKFDKRRHQRLPEAARTDVNVERLTKLTLANRQTIKEHCGVELAVWEVCGAFEKFHCQSRDEQRVLILDWFPKGVDLQASRLRFPVPGHAQHETLCTCCWAKFNGNVTLTRLRRHRKLARLGQERVPRGAQLVRPSRTNRHSSWNAAVQWLMAFARWTGDHMPDVEITALPVSSRKELYETYATEWASTHMEGIDREFHPLLCRQQFLKMFQGNQLMLAIQKHKRFAQCSDCFSLHSAIALTKSEAAVAQYVQTLRLHRAHVANTKGKYYKHMEKARGLRTKVGYLSIIIDGMDQSKTNVPHVVREAKGMDSMEKLNVHVTGFIAHGFMHAIYTWLDNFAKDPNMTITILVEGLHDLRRLYGPSWKMPRKLYLQLDNPTGENKNKFLIMFLACLVYFCVFDKIKLSFLLVGHTHEDIDQFFSRLSVVWRGLNFYSVPQMMQFAKQVSYKRMTTEALKKLMEANVRKAEAAAAQGAIIAPELPAAVPEAGQYPGLNVRQLTSVGDFKLWMQNTRVRESWVGLTKYKCMVIARRINPETQRRSVVLKVRQCMCSESDESCEVKDNYWEPRRSDGQRQDGIVLIPEDAPPDALPDISFIPATPLKPLTVSRLQLRLFFTKIPGAFPESDAPQPVCVAGAPNYPISRDPLITDGVCWFEELFDLQDQGLAAMCAVCRRLRVEGERLKGEVKSFTKAKELSAALAIYQSDACVVLQPDVNDGESSEDEPEPDESASSDVRSAAESLRYYERLLRQNAKALNDHLKNPLPEEAELHQVYTTVLFKTRSDGTLPVVVEDDIEMLDPEEADDDPPSDDGDQEHTFLWEDEKACQLRIGRKRKERQPHARGALVGDLALVKIEGEEVALASLLGRDADQPTKLLVHWYGNAQGSINGPQLPCWIDTKATRYYRKKPQHPLHHKHEDSIWPHALVTWACDWKLNKSNKLPELAKRRVMQTDGLHAVFD